MPGLLSVWVNGRSRPTIMEDMRARIKRCDIKLERLEAIKVEYSPPYYVLLYH
jgi:OHCU decarboxylase